MTHQLPPVTGSRTAPPLRSAMHADTQGYIAELSHRITGALGSCPDELTLDGDVHRFKTPDKPNNRNGWLVGHILPDGQVVANYGAWHLDFSETYRSWESDDRTWCRPPPDPAELRRLQDTAAAQLAVKHARGRRRAVFLWNSARVSGSSPYLERKQVAAHGCRFTGNTLLVPIRDAAGQLVNVQQITPNGEKKFTFEASIQGCYGSIGTLPGAPLAYLAEGYATAATLHEATTAPVIVAFTAGNLEPAAAAVRRIFPDLPIIVAADNDHQTAGNPGVTAAETTAEKHGLTVVFPRFQEGIAGTDFNDLGAVAGLDEVRRQLGNTYVPSAAPDLSKNPALDADLKKLAACSPRHARQTAAAIISRYQYRVPYQITTADLLDRIRQVYPGNTDDLRKLARYAAKLESKRCREALRATRIADATFPANVELRPINSPLSPNEIIQQYSDGQHIVLLPWSHATGKTTLMREIWHCFPDAYKVLVAPTQALISQMTSELHDCIDYRQHGELDTGAALTICVNSIINRRYAEHIDNVNLLMIDEVTQCFRRIFCPNGIIETGRPYWETFCKMVNRAQLTVLSDADMDVPTIATMAEQFPDKKIVVLILPKQTNITIQYGTDEQIRGMIDRDIAAGLRVGVFADAAKVLHGEAQRIREQYPDRQVLCLHKSPALETAGTPEGQAFLLNPNVEITHYDVLMFTPVMNSGVSITTPHLDRVYGIYTGAILPSDFIQMSRRIRTAQEIFIGFDDAHPRKLGLIDATAILKNMQECDRVNWELLNGDAGIQLFPSIMPASKPVTYDAAAAAFRAAQNRQRNHGANCVLWAFQQRGFTIKPLSEETPVMASEVIKETRDSAEVAYKTAVIQSRTLTDEEAQELQRSYTKTAENSAALERWKAVTLLGIQPDELNDGWLDLYNHGQLARKLTRFDLLTCPIGTHAGADINELVAALPLADRHHHTAEAQFLLDTFELLGIDPRSGIGEFSTDEAAQVWDTIATGMLAAIAASRGYGDFSGPPLRRPVARFSAIMRRLGLRLESAKRGPRGNKRRFYWIDPEAWEMMREVQKNRRGTVNSYNCYHNNGSHRVAQAAAA